MSSSCDVTRGPGAPNFSLNQQHPGNGRTKFLIKVRMSLRIAGEVGERPRHNPYQLRCPFASCRRWFRNQSGLTKHIRSWHWHSQAGQATSPRRQRSPSFQVRANLNADELRNNQGNLGFTPPSTPLAGPPSPSVSEINQTIFDNTTSSAPSAGSSIRLPPQDGLFSPVHNSHGSLRESSPEATPEGDEPISKIFHPIINGSYTCCQ